MGNEKNIDQLFKDKLAGREAAAYSEAAWASAAAGLNSHFRMLLLKKIALIAAPILLLAGVGVWYQLSENKSTENQQELVVSDSMNESATENATIDAQSEKSVANEAAYTNNEIVAIESADNNSSSASISEESNNKITEVKVQSNSNSTSTNSKTAKSRKSNSIEIGGLAVSGSSNAGNASTIDVNSNTNSNVSSAPNFTSNNLQTNSNQIAFESKKKQLGFMPIYSLSTLGNKDAGLQNPDFTPENPVLDVIRKIELSLDGGAVLANGFTGNSATKAPFGYGFYAGVSAKYHFKPRMYLYSGLILNQRNAISSSEVNAEGKTRTLNNATYLDIPIHFGYRMAARHNVSFGMTFSPLVLSSSTIAANADAKGVKQNNTAGLANFDVAGTINYNFNLTQRLDFDATFRYGLFDITDDSYFGTGLIDDRNHQFRIGLSYRLLAR